MDDEILKKIFIYASEGCLASLVFKNTKSTEIVSKRREIHIFTGDM